MDIGDFRNGKKILGILLVVLTNLAYIGSNYAVKWAGLGAGEVSLVRGGLQVLVFSSLLIINREKAGAGPENNEKWLKFKKYFLVGIHGFLNATIAFVMVLAVTLMPIGDLVVISFSSPVFSLILESLVLKRPMTVLSIVLCISIGNNTIMIQMTLHGVPKQITLCYPFLGHSVHIFNNIFAQLEVTYSQCSHHLFSPPSTLCPILTAAICRTLRRLLWLRWTPWNQRGRARATCWG